MASKLIAIVCLISVVSIQSIRADEDNESMYKWPLPTQLQKVVEWVVDPIIEMLEPFKVGSSTSERGLPETHDKLGKFEIMNTI